MLSSSRGFAPDQGFSPWTLLWSSPDPHYRLGLCAPHEPLTIAMKFTPLDGKHVAVHFPPPSVSWSSFIFTVWLLPVVSTQCHCGVCICVDVFVYVCVCGLQIFTYISCLQGLSHSGRRGVVVVSVTPD